MEEPQPAVDLGRIQRRLAELRLEEPLLRWYPQELSENRASQEELLALLELVGSPKSCPSRKPT